MQGPYPCVTITGLHIIDGMKDYLISHALLIYNTCNSCILMY